jgi:glycine/D-amino acid oxidase-like deaminating enzyme
VSTVWDLPYAPLPRLQADIDADVCVIGLGGAGLAAVRRLQANRVNRIVGIDAHQVASGASGRNGGLLRAGGALFHHRAIEAWGREPARRLYGLGLDALDRLERRHPALVSRIGCLRLPVDAAEAEDIARHADALRGDGFAVLPGDQGGLLVPGDGVLHPVERCQQLADEAWEAGAWLYGDSPALEIGDGEVRTPEGRVRCGAVLVCVDGGLERVLPELQGRVRSVRLQILATAPVPDLGVGHAVSRRYGMDYWHQTPQGRVVLGGCRDLGGEAEEGVVEPAITDVVQAGLERLLAEVVPMGVPVAHRWAGIAGYTDDHLPIVEEVRPGVWAIGGYCGTGNLLGTQCGEAAADMVAGRPRPELLDVLAAARAE